MESQLTVAELREQLTRKEEELKKEKSALEEAEKERAQAEHKQKFTERKQVILDTLTSEFAKVGLVADWKERKYSPYDSVYSPQNCVIIVVGAKTSNSFERTILSTTQMEIEMSIVRNSYNVRRRTIRYEEKNEKPIDYQKIAKTSAKWTNQVAEAEKEYKKRQENKNNNAKLVKEELGELPYGFYACRGGNGKYSLNVDLHTLTLDQVKRIVAIAGEGKEENRQSIAASESPADPRES